jgi:hypothetical protein
MQGNPAANNVKWGLRALSVVLIPLTASFPQVWLRLNWNALRLKETPRSVPAHVCVASFHAQGVFIYWITSNTYSFFQALGAFAQHVSCVTGRMCAHMFTWLWSQSSSGSRCAMRWAYLTCAISALRAA